MYEHPEMHVSSAKQLMELNKKREEEAKRAKVAENLAAKQVALLEESNELAKAALAQSKNKPDRTDLFDVKPNISGVGLNLNEAWRRIKNYFLRSST